MIYVIQRGDADGRRLFVAVSKPIEILNNVITIKISSFLVSVSRAGRFVSVSGRFV